ncbi:MAG: ABC transporter substrate-binding protein [Chloroflexi bacterium]|nr:ABC transporter substrate-binding protein [Chloroflexota bacterium]
MAKRTFPMGALFVTVLALAFAFSLSITPLVAQDNPTPTPIVAEAGSGGTQIVFWNGLTGSDGVTLNEMTKKFAEENPGYSVRTESMVWDVLYQKLQAALVAGDAPDVVVMHTDEMPQFVNFGALQPVDFIYGTGPDQIDPADFSPSALESLKMNDQYYGVFLDNHGWGTWVNNALFEAAGLDPSQPPVGFDAFVEMAQKLTLDANGKHPNEEGFDPENIVQYGTTVSWMRVTFLTLLYQNGGRFVNEDGTTGVNSEAGMRALQMMHDLIFKYNVAPKPAGFDNWQSFAAGRIAIIPEGSWFRNFLVLDNPDIEFTVWPMVQLGDQPATWMSAHVFYIPVTTEGEKLAAVQKYIKWISDNSIMWAESGQIPARLSLQAELDPDTYPSNIVFAQAFNEFGRFDEMTPARTELMSALDPELDAVLNGQKSVEEGLNAAAERMNAILARG